MNTHFLFLLNPFAINYDCKIKCPLTKVIVVERICFTGVSINAVTESPDEVYDCERRRQCRLVVVLVDQRVAVKAPDFLRVFLNFVECVAER